MFWFPPIISSSYVSFPFCIAIAHLQILLGFIDCIVLELCKSAWEIFTEFRPTLVPLNLNEHQVSGSIAKSRLCDGCELKIQADVPAAAYYVRLVVKLALVPCSCILGTRIRRVHREAKRALASGATARSRLDIRRRIR